MACKGSTACRAFPVSALLVSLVRTARTEPRGWLAKMVRTEAQARTELQGHRGHQARMGATAKMARQASLEGTARPGWQRTGLTAGTAETDKMLSGRMGATAGTAETVSARMAKMVRMVFLAGMGPAETVGTAAMECLGSMGTQDFPGRARASSPLAPQGHLARRETLACPAGRVPAATTVPRGQRETLEELGFRVLVAAQACKGSAARRDSLGPTAQRARRAISALLEIRVRREPRVSLETAAQ